MLSFTTRLLLFYTISLALYKEKSLLLTQLIFGTGLDYSDHKDATLPHYHSDRRQAVLSPPSSSAASRHNDPNQPCCLILLTENRFFCKIWILHIRTYWCKILLDCQVNQLECKEPRFQHLLINLLDFHLVQSDAVHPCLLLNRLLFIFPCHVVRYCSEIIYRETQKRHIQYFGGFSPVIFSAFSDSTHNSQSK